MLRAGAGNADRKQVQAGERLSLVPGPAGLLGGDFLGMGLESLINAERCH